MQRNICFVLIFVMIGVFFFTSCNSTNNKKKEDYLHEINSIIKEMDFYTAKANDNKIILYDTEQEMIKEIPFENYDDSIKFIYARKENSTIYFVRFLYRYIHRNI